MINMRKTKIIVTLGPAVDNIEKMRELIRAGANIARFNVAHGTIVEHRALYEKFRRASVHEERSTATMLDIKGPEIRTSNCRKGFVKEGRYSSYCWRRTFGDPRYYEFCMGSARWRCDSPRSWIRKKNSER